jgi:propionate CoA-transferase
MFVLNEWSNSEFSKTYEQLAAEDKAKLRGRLEEMYRKNGYDAASNTLFLNFRHLQVRSAADIESIRSAVALQCDSVGRRVQAVVNYDGFQLAPGLEDEYAAMAHEMHQRFYDSVTRYASGAFKRMKIARALEQSGD